jgi:hypothetical protein
VERDISLPITSTVDYNLLEVFAENGNGSLRDEIATERCYLFGDTSWERGKYTGPTEFVVLFFGSAAIPLVTYPRGRIDLFVDGGPFSIHLPEFTIGKGKFFFALYVGDDGSTYYVFLSLLVFFGILFGSGARRRTGEEDEENEE